MRIPISFNLIRSENSRIFAFQFELSAYNAKIAPGTCANGTIVSSRTWNNTSRSGILSYITERLLFLSWIIECNRNDLSTHLVQKNPLDTESNAPHSRPTNELVYNWNYEQHPIVLMCKIKTAMKY